MDIFQKGELKKLDRKKVKYVVGVDFGTSGTTFSFCNYTLDLNQNIKSYNWGTSNKIDKNHSQILYYEKTVKDWGNKGRKTYFNSKEPKYTLFESFKLSLYNEDYLNEKSKKFKLVSGEEISCDEIITHYLTFLYSEILQFIIKIDEHVVNDEIRWVFTVPAIWRHDQLDKMKRCCVDAGFIFFEEETIERFCFCFEPEAAALCIFKNNELGFTPPKPKSNILIYDLGGGTVDITCHEIQDDGRLKESHPAKGKILGSQILDQKFYKWFIDLLELGDDNHFEKDIKERDNLLNQWINCKETFQKGEDLSSLKFSKSITKILEEKGKKEVIEKRLDTEEYLFCMKESDMKEICSKHFQEIVKFLKDYIDEVPKDKKPSSLILTGGLSKNDLLFEMIDQEFGKIFKPKAYLDAINAVSKGACYFGLNPQNILPRKSKCSYFLKGHQYFNKDKHNPKDKERDKKSGNDYAQGFVVLSMENDEPTIFKKYYPLVKEDQVTVVIEVFASKPGVKPVIKDRNEFISLSNIIDDLSLEIKFEIKLKKEKKCYLEIEFGKTDLVVTARTDLEEKSEKLKIKKF